MLPENERKKTKFEKKLLNVELTHFSQLVNCKVNGWLAELSLAEGMKENEVDEPTHHPSRQLGM